MIDKNELILRNQFFEYILQNIDVGIHAIDQQGNTLIYNRKMKEIEGMEMEEVLEKNLLEVFSFHSNENSTLLEALRFGKEIKNAKQTYFNNKGQMITTINHTLPVESNGKKIGALEIARDVTKLEKLIRENIQKKGGTRYTFDSIIGSSIVLKEVIEASKRAARTSSSILITGETGTGKELFAQSIHNGSSRSSSPFISQNCAALPDSLIEGILFGTKKGAFTGAIDRPGLFEQAQGGTLLLDEINSLAPQLQAKLLRVLQERVVRRIGDTKDRPVDVKIIATINEDPIDAISQGRLRKDLYYRLSVVSLFIPPLRERKSDISDLSEFFIEKYNHLFGMNIKSMNKEVLTIFEQYDWPGNVRELEHIIEGTMNVLESEDIIDYSHLPIVFRRKHPLSTEYKDEQEEELFVLKSNKPKSLQDYMNSAEIYYIKKILMQNGGNITKAAEVLGMSRQNLQYRIKKLKLKLS